MQLITAGVIALTLLSGADGSGCHTGEDTHPNAPQQPGPERGGPPAQGRQQPPQPAPGDPAPHLDDLKRQVQANPHMAVMVVLWTRERVFYAEYTTEAGQRPRREEQRAQNASGGWWVKVVQVRPGQTIGFTAGPVHMNIDAEGTAQCWIYHASGAGGLIADWQTVPRGPCAASYTISA
jgi:hypothetical protein